MKVSGASTVAVEETVCRDGVVAEIVGETGKEIFGKAGGI